MLTQLQPKFSSKVGTGDLGLNLSAHEGASSWYLSCVSECAQGCALQY